MATIQLPRDFREFIELLNSERVEYLLVGGFAVAFHGFPRATGDLDIWVAATPENASRLVAVLRKFGFSAEVPRAEDFLKPDRVIQMGVPPLRIDLLTGVSGVNFEHCYMRRTEGLIHGVAVSVINAEDLKTNKQASGRPKDLNDLGNLP